MDDPSPRDTRTGSYVAACGLAGLGAFQLLALASFRHEQLSALGAIDGNLCGHLGARLAGLAIASWGIAAFLLPLLCLALALVLAFAPRRGSGRFALRLTGALLLVPASAALAHLLPAGTGQGLLQRWDQIHLGGLGGHTGWLLSGGPDGATAEAGGLLRRHLATPGSALVLVGVVAMCLCLLQLDLIHRGRRVAVRIREGSSAIRRRLSSTAADSPPLRIPIAATVAESAVARDETTSSIATVSQRIQRDSTTASAMDPIDLVQRIRARRQALNRGESVVDEDEEEDEDESIMEADEAEAEEDEVEASPSPARRHSTVADRDLRSSNPAPPKREARKPKRRVPVAINGYVLPPVDLLADSPAHDRSLHLAESAEVSEEIEALFKDFSINVKVVAATRGPTITMYELELLDAGMRVNKVAGFEKDLSLKLGTDGIRIVAPLPNKKTIGIEVPNRHKVAVVMRDLVDEIDPDSMALPVIIGRDVIGRPMVGDLAKMPHLLIAGATGTGKSVCLNAIIASILLFRGPEETKFIMVDPKMVELAGYDGIPHLLTPPITDMTRAHAALEWCCKTMDERFFALRMCGCRDLLAFNKLSPEDIRQRLQQRGKDPEELGIPDRMPFIVVVVDEYADLMMVNKEVERSLVRLTAKARACGIHVILATQRPSADVVTGLIKSNLPARICCRVADKNNSRVVLDAGGAENLLGRGDMLYLMPGTSNLCRGQGVWVQDAEIEAVIEHARNQGEPEYDESITTPGAAAFAGGGGTGEGNTDEWLRDLEFHAAVWAMYKHNRTGADFLRRKLQIGYNKATKYIEWLEDMAFLNEAKGSRPREFLKSWDDWLDELKANDVPIDPEQFDFYTNPFA